MSIGMEKGSGWQWLLPSVIPGVALVVVPAFASPFLGAKTACLLIAGAFAVFACLGGKIPGESTMLRGDVLSKFFSKSLYWSAGFWAVAIMASALRAHNWAESWRVLAPCAAAALLLIAFIRRRIAAEVIVVAIAMSAVAVAAFAISGRFGYDLPHLFAGVAAPGRMRAASTLGNPLFVASFLSCAIWAVLALPLRWVWRFMAALVIVGGMAATTERTALFAFAAGAIVFALSGGAAFRQRALVLTLLLLLAGWYAFGRVGNPRSPAVAAQGRVFLWKHALRHTTLLGSGPGSFYRVYNKNLREAAAEIPPSQFHFINYETDSYNIFVQELVEDGWLSLAAMLAFFAAWFRLAWRASRNLGGGCALAGVAAFLASG
ncbi:MAG: hypothetical protein ACRDQ5_11340, partial [Sciscionella sp.]